MPYAPENKQVQAEAMLREALAILDELGLYFEATLVCRAIDLMSPAISPADSAP